jgi:hypothetical protein
VRGDADETVIYDRRHRLEAAATREAGGGQAYRSTGGTLLAEDWLAEPGPIRCTFTVPAHGLAASFDADEATIGGQLVSNAEQSPCYFLKARVGGEKSPVTTSTSTVPERLTVVSDWYDTDIFDYDHAGSCS